MVDTHIEGFSTGQGNAGVDDISVVSTEEDTSFTI